MKFDFLPDFLYDPNMQKALATVVVLMIAGIIKTVLTDFIKTRAKKKRTGYRSKVNTMRNVVNISIVFIIIALWASEIQSFALSIAAFIFAIVFATKEFIQCFIGYIYFVSARPFRIGDWVQLKDGVGEVIAVDWTKVTLLEVDLNAHAYTGKHVFIPNSQIMLKPVRNLNFMRRYALNSFTITSEPTIDVFPVVEQLRKDAKEYCADFIDVAERYKGVIEKRLDVDFIPSEPHFSVSTNDFAKVCVHVDVFCPVEESVNLQQMITQRFFHLWHKAVTATPAIERRRTESNELLTKK